MGRQFNPTPRSGFAGMSSRPVRTPKSGLPVEVYVSQHKINPVSHSSTVTGGRLGGGKPPSLPATRVAETATLLATVVEETDVLLVTVVADTVTPLVIVKAAMKETKSL